MSQSATPARQNSMNNCLETFEAEMFCSFPHRHGEATGKPETPHFVRDFLLLTLCSLKIDVFLLVFSSEPRNLQPQNRCFVRGFRQFSAHRTKRHACHGICTLSPLDAALPMRFTKTRNTTRLKCCACHAKRRWTRRKCCACQENCNASSENVAKVLHLPHKTTLDI